MKARTTYGSALDHARAELEEALGDLEEWDQRLDALRTKVVQLRRTVTALSVLCNEPTGMDDLGITDACRVVMDNATHPLTTKRAMQLLEELGFDLASQKNAAASVTTVLGRLEAKGRIRRGVRDGDTMWIGPHVPWAEDEAPAASEKPDKAS
jgi:hypothetical protein